MTTEGASHSLAGSQLFELVAGGNRDGAVRFVHSLLLSAADPVELIEHGLVEVQRRIGESWEVSLIDVGEAHEMTSIVEELLSAIVLHLPLGTPRQRVVFACPEREWHSLPARMTSELLRTHDWAVTFAGASTPSATLAAIIRSQRPLAAVLSCTTAAPLLAAREAIEVSHEHHVPVLVGGAGFGPDDYRARALGADGWARSVSGADRILTSWSRRAPTLKAPSVMPVPVLSTADAAEAADAVLRRIDHNGLMQSARRPLGVSGPDVSSMLDLVNAALLTADPRVWADMLGWYRRIFGGRGLPDGTLEVILAALSDVLPPIARSFVTQAAATDSGAAPKGGPATR